MKFLIQKVKNLKIYRNKHIIFSSPEENICYLVYVGIEKGDENKNLEEIVASLENLQIIDENGKFLKSLKAEKPALVFVSQITLIADFDKGRINFNRTLDFSLSKQIFEKFIAIWQNLGYNIFNTEFGSFLEIEIINIGPVNFFIRK